MAYPGGGVMARRNMQQKPDAVAPGADELRTMMRQVIAADAAQGELRDAVKAIEDWVGEDKARQSQLGRMAGAVLERGLGSELARETIKTWHEKYRQRSE
jgi:hypothetical protein